MPVKIRLQRHGKKAAAFFHIVIADGRAPRDGKFIEKIGTYNPTTNPATINLDADKALTWLNNGAQPTDTCRAILSYKGVLYKNHLLNGVKKGALTAEQVEAKFAAWEADKAAKIQGKVDSLGKNAAADKVARMKAEADANAAKAKAIEEKNTPAEEVVEAAAEETVEATEEAVEATEETAEATEAPADEAPAAEGEAEA